MGAEASTETDVDGNPILQEENQEAPAKEQELGLNIES